MKKLLLLLAAATVLLLSLPLWAGTPVSSPHIQHYLGAVDVPNIHAERRNTLYWSVGTDVQKTGFIKEARQVLSSGIAQADFRLCTYEDGSPILEEGKYFFCVTARLAGNGCTVYSYDLNTSTFTLIGCLQGYDREDCSKPLIAPHILCNREDGYWYVFAHWATPHHLCVGRTLRDPRRGYNEIITHPLLYEDPVKGDEDSFVYHDRTAGQWVLVYSQHSTTITRQAADKIEGPYHRVCATEGIRSLTGINVVPVGGKKYVVSGFGLNPDADAYKVFHLEDLSLVGELNLDLKTGGFRGWGTIFPVVEGERTKYQFLTFDRINPVGTHRWNYGNLYLYESIERNPGVEFDLSTPGGGIYRANAQASYSLPNLHFVRRFSKRLDYSQEIAMGELDLSSRIFLPLGQPYPVRDSTGTVTRIQTKKGVEVLGKGRFSLLVGGHVPGAEYVLDLQGLQRGEMRFLSFGTLEEELLTLGFQRKKDGIEVNVNGEEAMMLPKTVLSIRILLSGTQASLIDATSTL